MDKRIAVITLDSYLYGKIYFTLKSFCDVSLVDFREISERYPEFDVILWDIDTYENLELSQGNVITVGYNGGELLRPFSDERLVSLISDRVKTSAQLMLGDRAANLRGEIIRLTEVEYTLLEALVKAGGEFVSRDMLISRVWGDGFDGGVLNVYIHYLREKLEYAGEKIIISSRKQGYKIDEKYLRGGNL